MLYTNFTIAAQVHTVFGSTITLVNVMEPLRQSQVPSRTVSSPLVGTVVPSPETQAARAFAFQGRCLWVVNSARWSEPENAPADDGALGEIARDRRASAIPAEGAHSWQSSRHPQTPSCRQGAALTKRKHRQVSGHPVIHEYRAVLTSPARELAGGISGTDVQGDDGLAPRNGVVWKSKPDLMGAVVLAVGWLGWPNGEHHPMGLSYGANTLIQGKGRIAPERKKR